MVTNYRQIILMIYPYRCWSLKFKQSDHQFLHQSNVFHHINNILSKSDDGDSEESFNISLQSGYEAMSQARKKVIQLLQIGLLLVNTVEKFQQRALTRLSVTIGPLPGDLSEGSDQRSRHQDVQSSCHDWQSDRRLHRDLLGIRR